MPQTVPVETSPAMVAASSPAEAPPASASADSGIGFFGARGKARELAGEVERLTAELNRLRADMQRLGVLSTLELEQHRERLRREVAEEAARSKAQLAEQIAEAQARVSELDRQESETNLRLAQTRELIVVTEETALLQEAGVYKYQHPLSDAVAYQAALATLKTGLRRWRSSTAAQFMRRRDGQ